MKKINTIVVLAFAVLAACATNPATSNLEGFKQPLLEKNKSQVLGVLEVELSSEQGSVSSAKFISTTSGLSAKGVAVPINSSNWVFTPGTTTFMTDANFKYLQNTITLENKTGTSFQNLAMYALNTQTNLGGTAFTGIKTLSNVSLTGATANTAARAVMPTHGMSSVTAVDSTKADMMIYTPAEAAAVQTQLLAPGFALTSPTVLEYGFVARNFTGSGRAIGTTATTCAINAFDGSCNKATITWAFKFPLSLPNSSNLGKFSLRYLVVNETVPDYSLNTQSLEEQTANTVAGNAAFFYEAPFYQNYPSKYSPIRTFPGTKYQSNHLKFFLQVKTAKAITSPALPAVFMQPTTSHITASGDFDNYFGASGYQWLKVPLNGPFEQLFAQGIAVQTDGKIVLTAREYGKIAVIRLNPDGTLDSSFGTNGFARQPSGCSPPIDMYGIGLDGSGKIVVAGRCNGSVLIARFDTTGQLDSSFSGDGIQIVTGSVGLNAYAMAVKGSGSTSQIVVVGSAGNSFSALDFFALKLDGDGNVDTSFNPSGTTPGIQTSDFNGGPDIAFAVAIQSDNKVLVAGGADNAPFKYGLARYTTNGTPDPSFDLDGQVLTSFGALSDNYAQIRDLKVLTDGSILAGGITAGSGTSGGGSRDYLIAKYTPSGSLSTSNFGAGLGYVHGRFSAVSSGSYIYGLETLSDGSIIGAGVTGNSDFSADNDTGIVKYNSAGVLDSSFGIGGKTVKDLTTTGDPDGATDVAITSDGKIVTAGWAFTGSNVRASIAKLNP
jgi:uncharacterized delta-60 repeat protein